MSRPALAASLHTARVAGTYARDRLLRPVARTPDDVPAFPTSVSAEWLTAVLCGDSGRRVVDWSYAPLSRGSTCRGRYTLRYDGPADDLPPTVFSKATSTFRTRLQLGSTGALRAEARFYRDVRPSLDVRAPRGYGGATDRRSGRSILLLEDIARGGDVEFADVRSLHVDRELAGSMVETLAALHGALRASPRFAGDLRWVIRSIDLQRVLNEGVDFERRVQIGLRRAGEIVPTEIHDRRRDLHRALMESFALDERAPAMLVHTDVHLGNWFVASDRRMGLCDWAAIARGQGARDLAYALMSALEVDDRRSWERALIDEYAEAAKVDASGVWDAYRRQTLHGLCFWLYTIGSGGIQPKTQPDEICRVNLARMGRAVVDLETLTRL